MKLKKKQEGITLIALIITIIVMLILVGVTINVALNGGLFTQAQDAASDTQKAAEREQLLSAVVTAYDTKTGLISKSKLITNLGTGWSVDGPEGGPYTVTSPKGNVFTVERNGNIIDGKVNGGEPSENENGFKIKVVQSYDITTNKIGLQITTEVTDEELAVEILAEAVNTMNPNSDSKASTLQDVNLFLANMDLAEGQESYSEYSKLVAAMAEMLNKDNPTDQEIFAYLNDGLTLKEKAANVIMQCTEFTINGKTIEKSDENLHRRETEIEYNGITENGEYNIKLKVGDKTASKTITVSSIVTEGTTVESAKIEKGYWYDVTSAYTDTTFEKVFGVVCENSDNDKGLIGFVKPEGNELTRIPTILGLYSFRENFEENGITYETAIVQPKNMMGSGSNEYEIVGWITKQGNLVLKNSTTKKFMEFAKQQMPNYLENFDEIYDTTLNPSDLLGGNNYTISFGLLKNGKCQYIYRYEEYGIEMIYSNGPVNYRIEDGKLIVEEIENWDYDTGTGGTGKGTYKEYTIGTEAIKR